jgi:hypothetical protein
MAACSAAQPTSSSSGNTRGAFIPTGFAGTAATQPANDVLGGGGSIALGTDNPGNPVISASAGSSANGAAGTGLKEGQCAQQRVTTTRIIPTIWLVVDGSGSMVTMLGDKSRWIALREALMDPATGVVKTLEHDAKFGLIEYDGKLPGGGAGAVILPDGGAAMFSSPPATTCPRIVSVEAKLDNFADIDKVYTPDPLGGSTPTDKAMQEVIKHLPPSAAMVGPDKTASPTIVVLATDGAPNDFCSMDFFPPDVRPAVIQAVQTLLMAGNKTYVISLAGDDMMLTSHLQDVAKAGGTGKPPYVPMNKDDLIKAFRDIIGPVAACDIKLNGMVKMGSECKGSLKINGVALTCNDANGWMLKDAGTISITGTACDTYKADAQALLEADFPCDIFALN